MVFLDRRRRDIHRNRDLPSRSCRCDPDAAAGSCPGRPSTSIRNRGKLAAVPHRSPQPPEPALRQCSHNLPAGFANSAISRTLQQKLHSPQAFPGIASMNFDLAMDFDSTGRFLSRKAPAQEKLNSAASISAPVLPVASASHHVSPSSLSTKPAISSLARTVRRCSAERMARRPANVLCRSSLTST